MDHLERIPAALAAASLSIYWGAVVVKLFKLARKIGKDPNALPRERAGQIMRILWYPVVVIMLAQAWISATVPAETTQSWMIGPTLERLVPSAGLWWTAAGLASVLCIVGTVFTFVCWRRMGRSWRIGIDPSETLALVSAGPYRWVRHPIYATRMGIDLCAWIMLPTILMGVTAAVDIVLMQIEARREETYMRATHGAAYESYMARVGRFLPRPPGG